MDPTEAVERLWPGQQVRVTALSGGITNHNFRVDVEGDSFVLRMGGAETALLGIDRRAEREANHRAYEVGVAPHRVGFAGREGWLIMRIIHGRPISREAMRGVLQSGISELDVDFDAYAAKHFERMFSHVP